MTVNPENFDIDLSGLKQQLDDAIQSERDQLDSYVKEQIELAVKPFEAALDKASGKVKSLIEEGISNIKAIVPSNAPPTPPVEITPPVVQPTESETATPELAPGTSTVTPSVPPEDVPIAEGKEVAAVPTEPVVKELDQTPPDGTEEPQTQSPPPLI